MRAEYYVIAVIVFVFLAFMSFALYDAIQRGNIIEDFCNERGYERDPGRHSCYKIQDDRLITKGVSIRDGRPYWLE